VFYHNRDVRRIRRNLPLSFAETIVTALVINILHYCCVHRICALL